MKSYHCQVYLPFSPLHLSQSFLIQSTPSRNNHPPNRAGVTPFWPPSGQGRQLWRSVLPLKICFSHVVTTPGQNPQNPFGRHPLGQHPRGITLQAPPIHSLIHPPIPAFIQPSSTLYPSLYLPVQPLTYLLMRCPPTLVHSPVNPYGVPNRVEDWHTRAVQVRVLLRGRRV